MLICTCDETVTWFGLANPKLFGERDQARQMLTDQPANRPAPGTAVFTDKGPDLDLTLIRPARKDETTPRPLPNWLRQRVEAIIWTLKNQLGLERHGGVDGIAQPFLDVRVPPLAQDHPLPAQCWQQA
jgi:hypothetical protein